MNDRKTETIKIGGGVQYAKVSDRVFEFHKDNEKCSIETSCEFKDGYVRFSATVTNKAGTFTGHSMDKIGGRQKQFEKQETIAVGRALAFAGYLASGDIACAEEMEDVVTEAQLNSLKMKFLKVNSSDMESLDRPGKLAAFSAWCKLTIGEDADYSDRHSWCREWYESCWQSLIGSGVSSDVPFS